MPSIDDLLAEKVLQGQNVSYINPEEKTSSGYAGSVGTGPLTLDSPGPVGNLSPTRAVGPVNYTLDTDTDILRPLNTYARRTPKSIGVPVEAQSAKSIEVTSAVSATSADIDIDTDIGEFLLVLGSVPYIGTAVCAPVPVHKALHYIESRAYIDTTSSSDITIQITRNGINYGNLLTIPAGTFLSQRDTSPQLDLVKDDILNFNITQAAGDGSLLTVKVQCKEI
jgi:hypothetical protein